jgi:hypothetical protein
MITPRKRIDLAGRVQFRGTQVWQCRKCGTINRTIVQPGHWRYKCGNRGCGAIFYVQPVMLRLSARDASVVSHHVAEGFTQAELDSAIETVALAGAPLGADDAFFPKAELGRWKPGQPFIQHVELTEEQVRALEEVGRRAREIVRQIREDILDSTANRDDITSDTSDQGTSPTPPSPSRTVTD